MNKETKIDQRGTRDELLWDIGLELLSQGNLMRFHAAGGSMTPFIRRGETVLIKPYEPANLKFGDIILYECLREQHWNPSWLSPQRDGKVVHRFLKRKKISGQEVLITKGDANRNYDQPVLPEQVLGKVVVVGKKGWKIRLDTKIGRLLNIFFAAISPFSFLIYPLLRLVKRTVRLTKYIKTISVHGSVADFES